MVTSLCFGNSVFAVYTFSRLWFVFFGSMWLRLEPFGIRLCCGFTVLQIIFGLTSNGGWLYLQDSTGPFAFQNKLSVLSMEPQLTGLIPWSQLNTTFSILGFLPVTHERRYGYLGFPLSHTMSKLIVFETWTKRKVGMKTNGPPNKKVRGLHNKFGMLAMHSK